MMRSRVAQVLLLAACACSSETSDLMGSDASNPPPERDAEPPDADGGVIRDADPRDADPYDGEPDAGIGICRSPMQGEGPIPQPDQGVTFGRFEGIATIAPMDPGSRFVVFTKTSSPTDTLTFHMDPATYGLAFNTPYEVLIDYDTFRFSAGASMIVRDPNSHLLLAVTWAGSYSPPAVPEFASLAHRDDRCTGSDSCGMYTTETLVVSGASDVHLPVGQSQRVAELQHAERSYDVTNLTAYHRIGQPFCPDTPPRSHSGMIVYAP